MFIYVAAAAAATTTTTTTTTTTDTNAECIVLSRYMATAAVDRTLKVWDVRKLEGPLQHYKLHAVASNLAFSQRGLLAVGMGNVAEVQRLSV